MRKRVMALNSIVVVFSLCFLSYTFLARQHLDGLAREFVTEKTLAYSKPIVEVAEEALESTLVQKLLLEDHIVAIRTEIADYNRDPAAYVSDLTRQQMRDVQVDDANPLLAEVASIREKIRTFYDDTMNALIKDLRIFSGSNLIAGMIAFGLAYCSSSSIHRSIVWFSYLMFVAVLQCTYLYIDGLTFFNILFRIHLGWWYAVFLCVVSIKLFWDYRHHPNAKQLPPRVHTRG